LCIEVENFLKSNGFDELCSLKYFKIMKFSTLLNSEQLDIDELKDNMNSSKSFVLPNNPKERFSEHSIKKLKLIIKNYNDKENRKQTSRASSNILN